MAVKLHLSKSKITINFFSECRKHYENLDLQEEIKTVMSSRLQNKSFSASVPFIRRPTSNLSINKTPL